MVEGEPGWIRAGYPTYASHDYIAGQSAVLIDLRESEEDARARIPGSVSIPLARLGDAVGRIPSGAPVVLYGADNAQALQGLQVLRQNGITKVSLVRDNLDGWIRSGGSVVSGQPLTRIRWQRRPAAGEVPVVEFREAMAGGTEVFFLDVRTDEEAEAGILPGAHHIPLDRLMARLRELPRDRTIFIYSAQGPRAAMAHRILAGKGFRCRYLAARVRCAGNHCRIEGQETEER